jgi:hypothetical protein
MPVTMSKGSANKNFYYEDSTLGTYILQANIYSEKGGPVIFSTQQQIIVAINSATTTPVVDQTPNNTEQTSSNNTTTQTGNTSVHYSSIPLSNVIPEIAYKVGAGRSRLGTVGTPIEFRGESNADFSGFTNYKWSFGDGAIGYGHIISHSYAYPGDYVVVLNATSPAGQAISRTDVKIIPADFVLSDISSERIEVTNNSNYEVNLFGRALQSEGKVFIFPEDTIIKVGQSISFGHSVTGLQPINIYDASLIVVGDTVNKTFIPPPSNLAVEKEKQVADLYIKAQALQEEIAALPPDQINQTENLASAIGSLESLPASVATSTLPTHRGWFQIIKEFFLGRK